MKKNSIAKICELPLDFKNGNKSSYQLAKDSGFINDNKNNIILDIKEYLQNHISLINNWEIWSKDKRTTEGFYLILENINAVGYLGSTLNENEKYFNSALDACSEYIYLEISSILNLKK